MENKKAGKKSACEYEAYKNCNLCARRCGIDRYFCTGYCGSSAELKAARAALHFWEEPCISGKSGSGAVFFEGCSLGCVFCQNYKLAHPQINAVKKDPQINSPSDCNIKKVQKTVNSVSINAEKLSELFLKLEAQGANNINLVTPTHYVPHIINAIELAKSRGIKIPFVYNTGTFETIETVKMLDGLIDVYMPDLKYYSSDISAKYSNAPGYFETASQAIEEMYRQVGKNEFSTDIDRHRDSTPDANKDGMENVKIMKRGVLVRHMMLPGCVNDSKKVLEYLQKTYHDSIYISIMSQYTPLHENLAEYPELDKKVSMKRYERLLDYAVSIGIVNAYIQEEPVSEESFIPEFDGTGVT